MPGFSVPLKHPNERCTSCGMWKKKLMDCTHCARLPNRAQVARSRPATVQQLVAQEAASLAGTAPSNVHSLERCSECGLWKAKFAECGHCAGRPNRMQAMVTKMLQHPDFPGHESFGGASRQAPLHDKERCTSCGLWKSKTTSCGFCLVRPNRMQAAVAAVKRPSSSLGLLRQMLEPGDSSLALKTMAPPVSPGEAAKVKATPNVGVDHHTWIHPPSPLQYHPKERCHSCGMWADKVKGCSHCATRCPTREQARRALVKSNSFVQPRPPLGAAHSFSYSP